MFITFSVCISIVILFLLLFTKWNNHKISNSILLVMWKLVLIQLVPFSIPILIDESLPSHHYDTNSILVCVYFFVLVCLLFVGLALFLHTAKVIKKMSVEADVKNDYYKKISEDVLGDSSRIHIFETEQVSFAFSFGVFRRYIVLPKWEDLSKEMIQCIIQHELTHIKRRDCLWRVLAYVLCSIHWYNPFVWCMYYQLNRQEELSCDEITIKRLGEEYRTLYLNAILYSCCNDVSKHVPHIIQTFGNDKQKVKERMLALMIKRNKKIALPVIVSILVMLICFVGHLEVKGFDSDKEGVVDSDLSTSYEVKDPNDNTSVTIIKHIESE